MGLFSKPKPQKTSIFGNRPRKSLGSSDTEDRIRFARDRSGLVSDTIDDYKKGRGFGSKTDIEDVRRELARKDPYFRHSDPDDIKRALDK